MTDEELGRLLSLISHEVRAPLGVMRGYLRLLEQQSTQLTEPHRHVVSAGLRAADRAAELLGQLSALARLHRGEVATTLRRTKLEPLLRAAVHAVTMPAEPAITLHVAETPDLAIAADEELLRVAIAGVTSAVVRAQVADARVYLLAREESPSGPHGVTVTIVAGDTVRPTHRLAPLDIVRGGLGLDLPIAAYVIAAHQGTVNELREDGRFAGVQLWLPVGDH